METERWKRWPALHQKLAGRSTRRLLALDGGGIRGVMTLRVLARIEELLREHYDRRDLVLADWFDYVAGTSTGAIIAAGIARGWPIEKLIAFYEEFGREIFEKRNLIFRWKSLYDDGPLQQQLRKNFDGTLVPDQLRSLLLVVTRNATTDSAWPVSSNPFAKYNDPERPDCNLLIPLWKLVRASTAAPVFFPPEEFTLGKNRFVFVDGGTTAYNNPAFLLFRMTTDPSYRLGWARGEKQMLLVSVGTGFRPVVRALDGSPELNVASAAVETLQALMSQSTVDQDLSCRSVGRCRHGPFLDREVEDMVPKRDGIRVLFTEDLGRAFSYVRYDAELTHSGLQSLGFADINPAAVSSLDAVDQMSNLQSIGLKVADQVDPAHFEGFM